MHCNKSKTQTAGSPNHQSPVAAAAVTSSRQQPVRFVLWADDKLIHSQWLQSTNTRRLKSKTKAESPLQPFPQGVCQMKKCTFGELASNSHLPQATGNMHFTR